MGCKAGVTFLPSFVPYLTVFHTSLVLAEVSAKFLSEANKNDLLFADNSTNGLTKYLNIVCAFYMWMDIRLIIY